MLKLKDFLTGADENSLCIITDVNGNVLINRKSVYEITELHSRYLDYPIINLSVFDNCFYIILDVDFI